MLALLNKLHTKSMNVLLLDFFSRHEVLQEPQTYPLAAGLSHEVRLNLEGSVCSLQCVPPNPYLNALLPGCVLSPADRVLHKDQLFHLIRDCSLCYTR